MKNSLIRVNILLLLIILGACSENPVIYEESWESMSQHEATPEWFRDAKFGIYFHWSIYTVPEFGHEWYPHRMYTPPTKSSMQKKQNFLDMGQEHQLYKKQSMDTIILQQQISA